MEIQELIETGNELRGTPLGSPKFSIWANDVRAAVRPYGNSMMEILESALSLGFIGDEDTTNDEQIDDTIEFLQALMSRSVEQSRAQDAVINQKQAEARETLRSKFGSIHVHGDATFGDNSPLSKITVGEFLVSLIDKVESMPESTEKTNILKNLKAVLANPTFAAVAGAGAGELIKHLMFGG